MAQVSGGHPIAQSNIWQIIPNLLSFARILLAFAFPFLEARWWLAVICIAALTEFLDGYLARRWHAETALGQGLDPVADKLFVFSTIATLISNGRFTWTQFVLVAMRDLVVAVGSLVAMLRGGTRVLHHLKPKYSGKIATTLQFALLFALFADWQTLSRPLFVLTVILSFVSAIDYAYTILYRRPPLANLRG